MTKLIAARPLRYGGKALAEGAHFDARTERDAKALVATGRAKQRDLQVQEGEPAQPRRYKRRDLRAES